MNDTDRNNGNGNFSVQVVSNLIKSLPEDLIDKLQNQDNEEDLADDFEFGKGISVSGPGSDQDLVDASHHQPLVNWANCKAVKKDIGFSNKEFSFKWEEVKRPTANQESEVRAESRYLTLTLKVLKLALVILINEKNILFLNVQW